MTANNTVPCGPGALASHGERPAILAVRDDSVETITYAALAERVEALATRLAADGVEPGERVSLFADASPAWIVACLALIRTRAVPVPLDTQLEDAQLDRILAGAAIDRVFADEAREQRLDDVGYDGRTFRTDGNDTQGPKEGDAGDDGLAEPGPDDVALLFFTSGTTGPPKGVPLKHRQLAWQVHAIESTGLVGDDDRLLLPLPLHHVYPLVIGVLVPLSMGLPVILPQALTGPEFLRAIRESGATVIAGVPRLYGSLVEGLDSRLDSLPGTVRGPLRLVIAAVRALRRHAGLRAGRWLLKPLRDRVGPALRLLASGGSPLDEGLAERLEILGWDVAVGYGLTETAPLLTIRLPGTGQAGSVGRALEDVELRIDTDVDAAADAEAEAEAELGEILARGPGVFDGYLDMEEETRKSFTDDGWFRTGDLGCLDDDGYLYVAGRKSTMIVTASGENIRTEALEEQYAAHPLIDEIGILKAGDRLGAVIVPDSGAVRAETTSVESALDEALRETGRSLPSYQRIDRYRISKQPLERTRLGKIKRHRLEARYEELGERGGGEAAKPVEIADMAPADRRRLQDDAARKVWDLLRERYPDRPLTPDSDLRIELGVDSMGWLDLSMDIAAATGIEIDEGDIAGIDDVRDLLEVVTDRPAGEGEPAGPLEHPEDSLSEEQKQWLERPPTPWRWLAGGLYAVNRGVMRLVWRLRANDIDPGDGGPLVFAPNHTSFLDPFALAAALPGRVRRNLHWGGWTGYTLRNRLFRGFSRLAGVVPVDPDHATLSSLGFATAVLERGRHLVWFPEGQRSRSGELVELRAGIGAILEAVPDARVVPVCIRGAFEAWPPDRRLPRPGRITVTFGRIRSPGQLADDGEGESRRQRIVNGLARVLAELCERRAERD